MNFFRRFKSIFKNGFDLKLEDIFINLAFFFFN